VIGIVSISSKWLKTLGLLAVLLDLAKLRLKNRKNFAFLTKIWISYFWQKSEYYFFGLKIQLFGCHVKSKSPNATDRLRIIKVEHQGRRFGGQPPNKLHDIRWIWLILLSCLVRWIYVMIVPIARAELKQARFNASPRNWSRAVHRKVRSDW